jgi:hypothetical protein
MRKFIVISILLLFNGLIFTADMYAECVDGNCDDGYKIKTLQDGAIFRGYSKNSKRGQGTMIWPNGDEYVGEWKDDRMEGQGIMTWANGDVYKGEWEDDIMNGQGTYIWADGDEYTGQWKDGVQDGYGTFTSGNGEVFSGVFSNGEFSR